jgi:hypothetical protein
MRGLPFAFDRFGCDYSKRATVNRSTSALSNAASRLCVAAKNLPVTCRAGKQKLISGFANGHGSRRKWRNGHNRHRLQQDCLRIEQLRSQRHCANIIATATPATMLAANPPAASSAVIVSEFNGLGKRSHSTLATTRGPVKI